MSSVLDPDDLKDLEDVSYSLRHMDADLLEDLIHSVSSAVNACKNMANAMNKMDDRIKALERRNRELEGYSRNDKIDILEKKIKDLEKKLKDESGYKTSDESPKFETKERRNVETKKSYF